LVPNPGLHHYYGRLERVLKGIALRLKLLTALEFLLRLASIFLVILLGSLFVHEVKEALPYFPFAYYLLALVSLLLMIGLGLWRTASRLPAQRVARGLEERFPQLRDDVTNSLLLFHQVHGQEDGSGNGGLHSDQISEGLITAHVGKTADEVSQVDPSQVVSFRRALRHLKLLLPLLVAFAAVLALDPQFLNRSLAFILDPFSALPVRETFISIEPTPSIVLRGTPLVIKAKTTGYIPDRLMLTLWPEQGDVIRMSMESEGEGHFTHRIASAQTSLRYQAYSRQAHSPVYNVRVVDAPEIGKVKLTLIPPGYTRLPREVKEEGHIEALKGTVVNLEARATKAIKEGKLILNQKDQLPLNVEGVLLRGNLLVFYPGSYSLSIKDEFGFENPNPIQYRIHLIPDKYPEGEIVSPTEDLEVSGNEVLPIVYAARDDFGVTAVRLIYQMGGRERSITLKSLKDSRSAGPELFKWDLAGLALTPGDRVAYRLEVWDNDSVSGPKAGHSRTFSLYVRDEKDRAARESEKAQEIADALLDLLADQLEEIKDRKTLSEEINKITEKVDKHLERMGAEKMERFDLESLKRNLATLNKRIHDLPKETVTQEMERLSLLAEDLAKKARMHEVEALAREMRNRQRRLIDALRDQKGPLTPEALQALMKELEKLKDLISQVMEALSQMATQLPDEFINSPELSGLDFQDLFKDLDEIQKQLMAGDLAGALEAAQRLLQSLSEMMAAMARAGAQASMGSSNRLQSEMSRQASELERILTEQKEILAGTESVDRELKRLMEEETEKRLNRMMSRLQETTEQLRRLLPSEQGDSTLEMERLLKEKQIERFSQLTKSLERELAGRPETQKLIDELKNMMKELNPDPGEVMTGESRERFPGLSSRQDKLQERTKDLGEKLEMLSQLFPGMDTEIINDIKDAAGSMGSATGRLKGEDAPGAIPPEQEAIRSLTRSQQGMEQMAQQMAMRMQANRWGYPWGYDPRAGWYYGPWIPMPTLPQPEVRRPRERGYTGIDREEFDPPSKDAYKAPQVLREKVMEALKEEIPAQYRREVERYFRDLTE
jgi:hypothetical protein